MSENDETVTDVPEDAPAWLEELVECVAETVECQTGLGWRWSQEGDEHSAAKGDVFEVVVYPRIAEVKGEPCTPSDIFYDVQQVLDLFAPCEHISLSFGCSNDTDNLAIEGLVEGHDVVLRLLMEPPDDEAPTLRVHDDGSVEEIAGETNAHYVEAANDEQAAHEDEHARIHAVGDVVAEIVRSWKADRLVPSEQLDRLAQLFVEVS